MIGGDHIDGRRGYALDRFALLEAVLLNEEIGKLQNIGFAFPPAHEIVSAIYTMAVTMLLLVLLMFSLGRYLPSSQAVNRLVLQPELASLGGYTASETRDWLMGKTGVALTALRPSGMATIGDERIDVVSQGDFVNPGSPIRVVKVNGSRVEVKGVEQLTEPDSEEV